jgi:hypothetical protein
MQYRLRWFRHIQRRRAEAPVRSGVIRRSDNEKRGRGRPNLIWEESVKRDLKDWCITNELSLDRREWKLAIHVPESWSSVPSFLLSSVKVFFLLFFAPFRFFCLVFYCFSPFIELVFVFIVLRFSSSFSTLFYSCFFGSCGFISNLP